MKRAWALFFGELNDFLPPERREVRFPYVFEGKPSVKDAIEALGPPHTEVDVIRLNGISAGFDAHLNDGDFLEAYSRDMGRCFHGALHLIPDSTPDTKFVLDGHLGRLAVYLRLLGFDVLHEKGYSDHEIVRIAVREDRIALTRDQGLLKHGALSRGRWIRSRNPREQLGEVVRFYGLAGEILPFTRCTVCNGRLEPVAKESVREMLQPETLQLYDEFQQCENCKRVYWPGSHTIRLRDLVEYAESLANRVEPVCPARKPD